jgi:hypothetical protein
LSQSLLSTPLPPPLRPPAGAPPLPAPGQLLLGRIQAARGSGVLVQLGWHALGLVALTDIHDSWVDNALAGLAEGTFVRARVLDGPPDARGRLRLTLRPSEGGVVEGLARPAAAAGGGKAAGAAAAAAAELGPEQLKEGSQVGGAALCAIHRSTLEWCCRQAGRAARQALRGQPVRSLGTLSAGLCLQDRSVTEASAAARHVHCPSPFRLIMLMSTIVHAPSPPADLS